ncbi:MAG: hypothetical protein ACOC1X_02235 [Promethearchaeota archaeon]
MIGKKEKLLIDFLDWYKGEYEKEKKDTIEMIVYKYLEKKEMKGGE